MKNNKKAIPQYPKYLWFLILSFSMVLAMSNWYDSRIIDVFGISVTPGSLTYSLTFLLSNNITEVYGFKNTRKAIWAALFFNVVFLIYGVLIMHLPSSSANVNYDTSFDNFLLVNFRIICASFLSYLISEPVNAIILAKIKEYFEGRFIGVRFILSTIVSGFIDSILFTSIAFYKTMPNNDLISLMLHIWLIKSFIEIIGLPISIRIAKKLKKIEKLDIYDTNTNFNIFSLDSDYKESDNKYNISE